MALDQESKHLILSNKGIPIVGLINKETKMIVLAPCIHPKTYLVMNQDGTVQKGYLYAPGSTYGRELDKAELINVSELYKKNWVPRLARINNEHSEKSAHEFLFDQKCKSETNSDHSKWGGFTITLNVLGKLEYEFASGAFNSPPGERNKGARLTEDLINEVLEQTKELESEAAKSEVKVLPSQIEQPTSQASVYVTPVKKRLFSFFNSTETEEPVDMEQTSPNKRK